MKVSIITVCYNSQATIEATLQSATINNEVRTHVLLGRTRRADAQSSDSETLSRIRSLVGYIIATRESDFSEATTTADDINGR